MNMNTNIQYTVHPWLSDTSIIQMPKNDRSIRVYLAYVCVLLE